MEDWLSLKRARRAGARSSTIFIVLAPLALLSTQPAQAASFDCEKAATAVEKLICADAELSMLDETLAAAYSDALPRAVDPSGLKSRQRAWLRDIRDACADSACLKAAYEVRIGELANIATPALRDKIVRRDRYGNPYDAQGLPTGPGDAVSQYGKYGEFIIAGGFEEADLCRAVERGFRESQLIPGTGELCGIPFPEKDEDFQRIPAWRDLDPDRHLQLVKEILFRSHFSYRHNDLRRDGVTDEEWERQKKSSAILPGVLRKFWDHSKSVVEGLIAAGRVRLQENRFDVDNDGNDEILYRMSALIRDRRWRKKTDGTHEYWLGSLEFAGKACRTVREGWDDRPYYYLLERQGGRSIMLSSSAPSTRLAFFLYRGSTHVFTQGSGNIIRLAPLTDYPTGVNHTVACHFLVSQDDN